MSNQNSIELRRAITQQLRSLQAAGVQDMPQPSPEKLAKLKELSQTIESSGRPAHTPGGEVASKKPSASPKPKSQVVAQKTLVPTEQGEGYQTTVLQEESRIESLKVLGNECASCTKCSELASSRTQTVFGVGNPAARLCFFGEAPGADEDRQGIPFVGKAGQLLTKIIEACTLTRDDVYILNVLRCRPPGNRNPTPEEAANCRHFFEAQLEIIQPEFICCLGSIAATTLLHTTTSIGRLRGKLHQWRGAKVLATYHPAYLLRNPSAKRLVWEDMQFLMSKMGIELPNKS